MSAQESGRKAGQKIIYPLTGEKVRAWTPEQREIFKQKTNEYLAKVKKGEVKPVDPEPKIAQIIKGEKETTRANGHMTKKKFSEMRIKLGKNCKTETGQDAAAVETEPKAERI